jgi:PBP1b-binding outer membrane lipoprotein LpoB
MKFKILLLLTLPILLLTSCVTDNTSDNQVSLVKETAPEFVEIQFNEAKSLYEVQAENLSLIELANQ